jgi:hypothetical protein
MRLDLYSHLVLFPELLFLLFWTFPLLFPINHTFNLWHVKALIKTSILGI